METSDLLSQCKTKSGKPTGFIIDESSHLRKGKASVGVACKYAGVSGKVDNCQVAVYCSFCNEDHASIIDVELFLPEKWTNDKERCDKAGIPKSNQIFQTKLQIALSIIKLKVKLDVKFDWIGGDGLYGHNTKLTHGLDKEGLFYVLDVHNTAIVSRVSVIITPHVCEISRGKTSNLLSIYRHHLHIPFPLSL